jgi:hypothetical protein
MNIGDVKSVMERISRLSARAKNVKGTGSSWSYTFPDGIKTTYILNEIKPTEELKDDISNAFIWFWNFKDYLKEAIKHQGGDVGQIEEFVDTDTKLAICADVANRLKHGSLNRSRSGKSPVLGELGYTVPQKSMKRLVFRGPEIEFDFQNFQDIEIKMPVLDSSNKEIEQALSLLAYAIAKWEQEFAKIV